MEVKEKLFLALGSFLSPIRERRKKYEGNLEEVRKIILEGSEKVRKEAQNTLEEVKKQMKLQI